MTRKKQHKIRDPDKTRRLLIEAVGEVLEKFGHTGLGVNAIARHLGRDKNLVRYYFSNIQNLKKAYILDKDYWLKFFDQFQLDQEPDRETIKRLFIELMQETYDYFKEHKEMQKLILWQINDDAQLLRTISDSREREGDKLLALTDPFFKHTGLDFRSVIALLLGGIYYIVLHAATNGSRVCGVDIGVEEESESFWRTVGDVIDWAFEAAAKAGGLSN